jgi:hypothetical protein
MVIPRARPAAPAAQRGREDHIRFDVPVIALNERGLYRGHVGKIDQVHHVRAGEDE